MYQTATSITRAAAVVIAFAAFLCAAFPAAAQSVAAPALGTGDPTYFVYLPAMQKPADEFACPTTSENQYGTVNVGSSDGRPAAKHGDLNLALRGYAAVEETLGLIDYNGGTDGSAPQLSGLFAVHRVPGLAGVYAVYDWVWEPLPATGYRGALLTTPSVTLLGMTTTPGETIRSPETSRRIYQDYMAVVLYAEARRITLHYTRADSVVNGYTVHIEDVCVDPNLLALYQARDGAGRGALPALKLDQALGVAAGTEMKVAIRDTGSFMDPRSHKDWWTTVTYTGLLDRRAGTARGW